MGERSFLKLYLFTQILTVKKSLLEDTLTALGLGYLAWLTLVDCIITSAHHPRPVFFSHYFTILLYSFYLFMRLVCFGMPLLQLLQNCTMRVSFIKLLKFGLIGFHSLFLHQLILNSHFLCLMPILLIFFFKLLKLLQIHWFIHLLHF